MIIENETMVTEAVIEAVSRVEDPRLREILLALVRHLHGFVREVRLTEREFGEAVRLIAALGQKTTASHNEVMLMAGSLGVSPLVCLLNNGNHGQSETQANMLGPFWRDDQPACASGDTLLRSPTPGEGLFVSVSLEDASGRPVAGAEVDVWHSSPEGLYENQDASQAEMNLRGRFVSGEDGRFNFRSVKPAGYPIPVDGPVGDLVRATRRHHYRPAHLHFMVYKPGFKTLISQVYSPDDPNIDSDVQFGVTRALIGNYVRHDKPAAEHGFAAPWYSLDQRFVLEAGEARRPKAPIRGRFRPKPRKGVRQAARAIDSRLVVVLGPAEAHAEARAPAWVSVQASGNVILVTEGAINPGLLRSLVWMLGFHLIGGFGNARLRGHSSGRLHDMAFRSARLR